MSDNQRIAVDPSGMLQKLYLDRLPLQIRNVLLYYIYPPSKHDRVELETVEVVNIKSGRTYNFPLDWKLNNNWTNVSDFVFGVIETINHSQYQDMTYPITLDLKVCKEMCRGDDGDDVEESIVISKKFKKIWS